MQHNLEKNQHSFGSDVVEKNHGLPNAIKALTPEGKKKLNFFDDLINLAVKEGKINESTARLITLTSNASARTVTLQ